MSQSLQTVALLLQGAILVTFLEGIRRRDVAASVNALVALAVALLPALLEVALARNLTLGPELSLWLAVAGVLHSVGMLGLYETTWWWDHLTHTVSAGLVAALLYAALVVTGPGRSFGSIAGLTVLCTLGIGVLWELIELVARDVGERFDVEPVLVHYGWRDTALDLVFDVVGAVLVVLLQIRVFVPIADQNPQAASALLLWGGGIVVVGTVLLALGVGVDTERWPGSG